MSRGARIVAIAVLGSLILAACSSSSDSSGDTGGGGGGSTEAPAQSDGGGAAGAFDVAQCAQVVTAMAGAAGAVPAAMSGGGGDLQASIDQLTAFAENAPDEIRDDFTTMVEGYAVFMQAMADAGYDPSSGQPPSADAMTAIEAASASLNTAEFQTASENVSNWFTQNCGG
jgi:hypothetical protein